MEFLQRRRRVACEENCNTEATEKTEKGFNTELAEDTEEGAIRDLRALRVDLSPVFSVVSALLAGSFDGSIWRRSQRPASEPVRHVVVCHDPAGKNFQRQVMNAQQVRWLT